MKKSILNMSVAFIVGMTSGIAVYYYYLSEENDYSKSMSILQSKGQVVLNDNNLTYIKGQYLGMDYEEVKALAVVSQGYESIAVMADESIIPKDSTARELYYSTDDNGQPFIK